MNALLNGPVFSQPAPMRRVWRIEEKDTGLGPWSGSKHAWDYAYGSHPGRMPGPYSDDCKRYCGSRQELKRAPFAPLMQPPSYQPFGLDDSRFGFPNVRTLLQWVDDQARLSAHVQGYVVRVYAVRWDRHILFENQIIYDAKAARLLRELTPLQVPVELEICRLRQMAG